MPDDGTRQSGRLAMRFLTGTVIVSGLVLAWLAWGTWQNYVAAKQTRERDFRIEELRGTIVHLDEVLTMSARMAAATGDPQWEARYRRFEPQLDDAIKEAISLAPGAYEGEAAARTDAANIALVAMENDAFDMVRAGRRQEARSLLFSEAYEERKRVYAQGMTDLAAGLARASMSALHAYQRHALLDTVFVALVLPVLAVGCVVALRAMADRHRALEDANIRLERQAEERAELNVALDRRVEERTRELEASRAQALARLQEAVVARTAAEDAEEALRHSEARFRTMVANIPGAVYRCACDEDWTMEYLTDFIEDLSGYPPSDFLYNRVRTFASIIHPDDREHVESVVLDGVERRMPYMIEYRIVRADGGVRWVYEKGQAAFGGRGDVLWLDGAIFDITDRKHADQELDRTMAELARSNAELEQFAYVASHDLQEPLRKVRAFGDRLNAKCADALTEQGRDYLRRMQDAAHRMSALISGLLVLSRVTTKARPFLPVDLGDVAEEVLGDLELAVERAGARVDVGQLPTIEADPIQMRELLQNLIGNALKFRLEGRTPEVQVRAESLTDPELGPTCRLTVKDNGIGFDPDQRERIFGVFQRLHARGDYEGTGVGLAICRKIVQRHGGRISAEGHPDRGATFAVDLPLRQAQEALT